VFGSDVIGWPHFLHAEFFGDNPERVTFLPECEQRLYGDFGTVIRIHRFGFGDYGGDLSGTKINLFEAVCAMAYDGGAAFFSQ
jgi:hypothetical protein